LYEKPEHNTNRVEKRKIVGTERRVSSGMQRRDWGSDQRCIGKKEKGGQEMLTRYDREREKAGREESFPCASWETVIGGCNVKLRPRGGKIFGGGGGGSTSEKPKICRAYLVFKE